VGIHVGDGKHSELSIPEQLASVMNDTPGAHNRSKLAPDPLSTMDRTKLFLPIATLFLQGLISVGFAQEQLTVDATKELAPPPRGRGPFPGGAGGSDSIRLRIRLELQTPKLELQSDGSALIDFVITNIGAGPVKLPIALDGTPDRTDLLTVWLTSDAIVDEYFKDQATGRLVKIESVGISAELYGRSDDPRTFHVLAPKETVRVHASSGVRMNPGRHAITAHGELAQLSHGSTVVQATADSEQLTANISQPAGR
jgi:hypothetical protein